MKELKFKDANIDDLDDQADNFQRHLNRNFDKLTLRIPKRA